MSRRGMDDTDKIRFLMACLDGVKIDYEKVADMLGITKNAATKRYNAMKSRVSEDAPVATESGHEESPKKTDQANPAKKASVKRKAAANDDVKKTPTKRTKKSLVEEKKAPVEEKQQQRASLADFEADDIYNLGMDDF